MKIYKSNGFTLIELMVTLAISAILLSLGISGMKSMTERGKLREQLSRFESSLKYARGEAVAKSSPVILCASVDGENCRNNNRDEWDRGWFMFLDADQDGEYDEGSGNCADGEDCLLRRYERITSAASGTQSSLSVRVLSDEASFLADGTIMLEGGTNNGANATLTIRVCMFTPQTDAANDENQSATIMVAPNGSIRTIRGTEECP